MKLPQLSTSLAAVCLSALNLSAQVCDPGTAPTGLTSTYSPGIGALLEWDAVPGSVGVLILAVNHTGFNESMRIQSFELDQFFIPEARLSPGTYSWQIQAACSTMPPFDVTPVSASDTFTVVPFDCPSTVTDIEGHVYPTVQIGGQCWMAANLQVERYRNGDNISTGLSDSAWQATTSGAFAIFKNVAAFKNIYGLLYNWYAVNDSRGLCPTGWHVPTNDEWTQLTDHLGGIFVAGGKMKATGTVSAGTGLWKSPNWGATNNSGFSGIPGGVRLSHGVFTYRAWYGYHWSSSEGAIHGAWVRTLIFETDDVSPSVQDKNYGVSVRCLRD